MDKRPWHVKDPWNIKKKISAKIWMYIAVLIEIFNEKSNLKFKYILIIGISLDF